jgi:hypothetical protein
MKEFKGLKIPDENEICCLMTDEGIMPEKCQLLLCSECIFNPTHAQILAQYIVTHKCDITDIIVPFGMLSEEKKKELLNARGDEKRNIQVFECNSSWQFLDKHSCINKDFTYRLNLNYKPKEKIYRDMTLDEIWEKRKEWEFEYVFRHSTFYSNYSIMFWHKILDIDDKTEALESTIKERFMSNEIANLRYRPINSNDDYKPLPKIEVKE